MIRKIKLGRPSAKMSAARNFKRIVFDLIPENGDPIQHKDLMKQLVPAIMAKQTLQDALNSLIKNGILTKVEMDAQRGAGKGYKFTSAFKGRGFLIPHTAKTLSDILKQCSQELSGAQPTEMKVKRMLQDCFYVGFTIVAENIYNELLEYKQSSDRPKAEIRLDFILKNLVVPMFKELADNAILPEMAGEYKELTKIAFSNTLQHGKDGDAWGEALAEEQIRSTKGDYCLLPRED